jgi:hypothetical protein
MTEQDYVMVRLRRETAEHIRDDWESPKLWGPRHLEMGEACRIALEAEKPAPGTWQWVETENPAEGTWQWAEAQAKAGNRVIAESCHTKRDGKTILLPWRWDLFARRFIQDFADTGTYHAADDTLEGHTNKKEKWFLYISPAESHLPETFCGMKVLKVEYWTQPAVATVKPPIPGVGNVCVSDFLNWPHHFGGTLYECPEGGIWAFGLVHCPTYDRRYARADHIGGFWCRLYHKPDNSWVFCFPTDEAAVPCKLAAILWRE